MWHLEHSPLQGNRRKYNSRFLRPRLSISPPGWRRLVGVLFLECFVASSDKQSRGHWVSAERWTRVIKYSIYHGKKEISFLGPSWRELMDQYSFDSPDEETTRTSAPIFWRKTYIVRYQLLKLLVWIKFQLY